MDNPVLTIDDVYSALINALTDTGATDEEAREYLNNNVFIEKLFDNLEKIVENKNYVG